MRSPLCLENRLNADQLATLRRGLAASRSSRSDVLPFGLSELDSRLAGRGLDDAGLHEFAAASPSLGDDAAATLFAAGIAARFVEQAGTVVIWTMTRFDLYAPGLEQVGLAPAQILYAQGRKDIDVLAVAEDALRHGGPACVVAEVKAADMTATRRLQLAAADGKTPMLLLRRHRSRDRCPLSAPSAAITRWRIASLPSAPLPYPGVGRARWLVELVRQRGGNPYSQEVEACDATGRLALSAPTRHRAFAAVGAINQAA